MTRRAAIVTGSTSGIGHEIARRLVADGFDLVVTGRSVDRGEQVGEELGAHVLFVPLDPTAAGAPDQLAAAAVKGFGRLDVLVNNAAMDHTDDLHRLRRRRSPRL